MNAQFHPLDTLTLPFYEGRRDVPFGHIVRLEGEGNYTQIVFTDGTRLMVALTLKTLLTRLPQELFVRLHRKHLINRAYLLLTDRRRHEARMSNGDCLPVSRRKAGHFFRNEVVTPPQYPPRPDTGQC